MSQPGFWDYEERLRRLSDLGDQLEAFSGLIDFEVFRAALEAALSRSDGSRGGRPPYDCVLMFKVLIVQTVNNLSDERTEFLINDRLSFMRFLGLGLDDRVPDARTIWLFREQLTKAKAIDALFDRFDRMLKEAGYLAMSGQLVDASVIPAPKQRNTKEEKAAIKADRIPAAWRNKPAKLRQKDRDARWRVKHTKAKPQEDGAKLVDLAIPEFGYKNHVSADKRHRLIRKWAVTDAAAHDGKQLRHLLDKENTASAVWADTGYRSKRNEAYLEKNGFVSKIHRKKPKGKPMPETVRKANAAKSKVRAPVEHIFGDQKHRMGLFVRTIGITRARTKIGLANLAYNMQRFLWLQARSAAG